MAARNLLRLADLTGRQELAAHAGRLLASFGRALESPTLRSSGLLGVLAEQLAPPRRIALIRPPGDAGLAPMLDLAKRTFVLRGSLLRLREGIGGGPVATLAPWTRELTARGGRTTAWVCGKTGCGAPLRTPKALAARLGR